MFQLALGRFTGAARTELTVERLRWPSQPQALHALWYSVPWRVKGGENWFLGREWGPGRVPLLCDLTKAIPLSALAVTLNVQTSCLQEWAADPWGEGWGLGADCGKVPE